MKVSRYLLAAGMLTSGLFAATSFAELESASAAATPNCAPSHITVTLGQSEGAAGTIYYPIVFTNHGAACAIWGVPAIQPVGGSAHTAVGPIARNDAVGMMPVRHVVANAKSVSVAYGVVESGNYTPSACVARKASGVVVQLGSFVNPTYVALPISVCTKIASTVTSLIVAGTTGT